MSEKDMKSAITPGDLEDAPFVHPGAMTSEDVDTVAAYAGQFTDENTYTRTERTPLRWKLDLRLVPLLWFNVALGAMDKATTAAAALYGFRADTGLTGDSHSWVSIRLPDLVLSSGSLIPKIPMAKLIFGTQIAWDLTLIGTGFANKFATLIALRILLGMLETPIVPGHFLDLGMWYSRRKQPLRTGLMYTGLSVCFTGPIGWCIGFMAGEHQWRSMFWITGDMTIVWACIVELFLPDNPVKAKCVTKRQKAIVIDRIRTDQTGVENKHFKKYQLIEALLDPNAFRTWLSICWSTSSTVCRFSLKEAPS